MKARGKRGNGKFYDSLTLKDAYEGFKLKMKPGTPMEVDYVTYRKVCTAFNERIMEHVLQGGVFFLPSRMGQIHIRQYEMQFKKLYRIPIDWAETKKQGKKVYNLNLHTQGNCFKFFWNRKPLKHQTYYVFKPIRKHSRKMAEMLKNKTAPDYATR